MHRIARSLRRFSPPALALPTAMVAMALMLRSGSDATDLRRWTAGDRATVASPAPAELAENVAVRSAHIARALGLDAAGASRTTSVDDRFHGRTVDETLYLDARGRPTGMVRLTPAGALLSAVRLSYREDATGALGPDAATAKAISVVAELGISPPSATPAVRASMNGGLWSITWARVVDGVPVDGDGTTVRIWRSGAIHSVTVSERPVTRPANTIGAAHARAALEAFLPALVTGAWRSDGTLSTVGLRWVAANDRYRPEGADAPASVLRLAYVFEMRFGGPSAELIRAATFWIDAETGELIGGDVLR